jgi:hypothetical protein
MNWHQTIKITLLSLFTLVACEETIHRPIDENPLSFRINDRQASALNGSAFATSIQTFDLETREEAIFNEIKNGNIPAFLIQELIPVKFSENIDDSLYNVTIYVMPDYLAIGENSDYFLMPMTPILAQKVMDEIGGILPTRKMVDLIWSAASVKLSPNPIPPSDAMITMPVFSQHNMMVLNQRNAFIDDYPLGSLVSGHKKDVILSNRIAENLNKVVIYGWHYTTGVPIQPLFSGHVNWYADYSHGIRGVLAQCDINNENIAVSDVLHNPYLYRLLSDENAPMEITYYDTAVSNYP